MRNGKPNFKMEDPQNFCTSLSFNRSLHGLAMRNTILVFPHRKKNVRRSSKLFTGVRFNIIKHLLVLYIQTEFKLVHEYGTSRLESLNSLYVERTTE